MPPATALVADARGEARSAAGVEVLVDDRDESAGAKFATMDLIGLPWQAWSARAASRQGMVELKRRAGGERAELPLERGRSAAADAAFRLCSRDGLRRRSSG